MSIRANSLDDNYDLDSASDHTMADQDDVIIAVMGCTGSGKSSFIKLLTGDKSVKIGETLESETSDIQIVPFLHRDSGRNVKIVDTPGFDDSREGVTDTDVLKKITDFLLEEYDGQRKLNGLIYVQRVSDPRFSGQSGRNLRMFRGLCGTENFKNVIVLTTFWDRVDSQRKGIQREEQLKTKFFSDLVRGDAQFMRHDRSVESANRVLEHIFTLTPTNVKITEEIREEGKSLEETTAGSVHSEEVERIISKHRAEMEEVKKELGQLTAKNVAMRKELEEERTAIQQKLKRWEEERLALKKGLDDETKSRKEFEERIEKEKADTKAQAAQAEMNEMKKRMVAAEREKEAAEQKLEKEANKSWMRVGLDIAEAVPLVPNIIAKPVLGAVGLGLDVVGRRKPSK